MEKKDGVIVLNDRNWETWKFQMSITLKSKKLYDCIEKPLDEKSDGEKDNRAQELIATRVEEKVLAYLLSCQSAYDMWQKLCTVYESQSKVSVHLLQQKFYNLKYEPPIVSFISKTEDIVSKLKIQGEEISEKMIITKIIMSLPDDYRHFSSAWESVTEKEQTLQNLTARLLIEEERILKDDSEPQMTTALLAKGSFKRNSQNQYHKKEEVSCFQCGKVGHFKKDCRLRKCNYCGKTGHLYKDCRSRLNKNRDSEPRAFITTETTETGWIMDTGATDHMSYQKELFTEYTEVKTARFVIIGDGRELKVEGFGKIEFKSDNNETSVLSHVLYVPDLKVNLFSILSAIEKGNYVMISTKEGCKFTVNGKTVLTGNRVDDMYKINIQPIKSTALVSLTVWHQRLAHQNINYVKDVLNKNNVKYEKQIDDCNACIEGKQHRLPFQNRVQVTKSPGDLIHMDLCGPMEQPSIGGSRFFLLLKDDYTYYRQVYFLKHKSETVSKIKEFIVFTERQMGHKIKIIKSDNGTEFVNQELQTFLKGKGIIHQTTVAYTPEQNGKAEREMRTLVEASRTMIQAKKLEKNLWAEAINMTAYILNRTGKGKEDKTPYQLWENKEYDITQLDKIFGTEVYTHIPKEKRRKWDSKSEKGMFVGYEDTKGIRVYYPNRRTVEVKRDIIFIKEQKKTVITEDRNRKKTDRREYSRRIDNEEEIIEFQEDSTEDTTEDTTEDSTEDRESGRDSSTDSSMTDDTVIPLNEIQNTEDKDDDLYLSSTEDVEPENRKRIIKTPKWMDDYEFGFATITEEELTYDKVIQRKDSAKWKEAIKKELEVLERNKTWIEVKEEENMKVIETKWVFKIKKEKNNKELYKARLVARGFQQDDKIDHADIYAPVAKLPTLRILLAIAMKYNLEWTQMDVKSAFLYGDIEEEVYIKIKQGPEEYTNKVFKLQKSLYGLKKSPRNWNDKFNAFMIEEGFKRSKADYCLYYKEKEKFYVLLYVDDLMIMCENREKMEKLKKALKNKFQITDLGENNNRYLGINIKRKGKTIELDQIQYLEDILKKYNMQDCNAVSTPIEPSIELTTEPTTDKKLEHQCRQLIGSLMYAMLGTRPDICYALSYLSRYQVYASEKLWNALKRILRYIKGTLYYKLIYKENGKEVLTGYTDADWGGDKIDRKSTTGYVIKLYGCTVSWCSSKQQCTALSSTESEYVAISKGIAEGCWITNLMRELGLQFRNFKLYVDNQSAIHIAKNPEQHKRLKHIDLKYHFIRDKVNEGIVSLEYIGTSEQIADLFTKPLPRILFQKHNLSL